MNLTQQRTICHLLFVISHLLSVPDRGADGFDAATANVAISSATHRIYSEPSAGALVRWCAGALPNAQCPMPNVQ